MNGAHAARDTACGRDYWLQQDLEQDDYTHGERKFFLTLFNAVFREMIEPVSKYSRKMHGSNMLMHERVA